MSNQSLARVTPDRLNDAAKLNPAISEFTGKHIMFYDGICSYCKGIVEAAMSSDQDARFFFSPLQSNFAQTALGSYGIDSCELRSMYVISDFGTSDEAVRAAAPASNFLLLNLSGELKSLGEMNARKPRAIQDAEYQAVADTRYNTHPKPDEIGIPDQNTRHRSTP